MYLLGPMPRAMDTERKILQKKSGETGLEPILGKG